jgi:SAM-dependent methyltransferase
MGTISNAIGYKALRLIAPNIETPLSHTFEEESDTKIKLFFGDDFFQTVEGKTIIDFGCGCGNLSVKIAEHGAAKVIGIDIQTRLLDLAIQGAVEHGVADHCIFTDQNCELADVVVSKDAFEHFSNPLEILQEMSLMLKPGGYVLAAFGPTWLHPYGGHLFSVFPWSHLLFSEESQIRWRSNFKSDGATRFAEVEGGLNQMTILKFERIVEESPFNLEWLDTIPIKGIAAFKTRLLREIGASIVRCKLTLN